MRIYHVSTWELLTDAKIGDTFTLRPGTQNAEGLGVYFAEKESVRAADSVYNGNAHVATIMIESGPAKPWFRSKKANCKNRPRTWHTKGKSIACRVTGIDGRQITCDWHWG